MDNFNTINCTSHHYIYITENPTAAVFDMQYYQRQDKTYPNYQYIALVAR